MVREGLLRTDDADLTGSRSLLRRVNCLGLLRAVARVPQTLSDLVAHSGLSRTAVDAVVSDLVDLGWLASSTGTNHGRLGRPASVYRLRPRLGSFLSIDIGANHVCAVLSDLTGTPMSIPGGTAAVTAGNTVRGQLSGSVSEAAPAEQRVLAALRIADQLLTEHGVGRNEVWVATIGSPGVIDAAGRVSYFGGTGMPGWIGFDLHTRFADEFAGAVVVEGDVALGAGAELAVGAAQGSTTAVYVLCGARTSGASIINGAVHRGVHGAAGIVGELEQLRWRELSGEAYARAAFDSAPPDRAEIFQLARAADSRALRAVDAFADILAMGAAAMTLTLDPELVVIGGGSSPSADLFLPRFERTLRRLCPVPPRVVASSLGSEAVAIGGLSLAAAELLRVLETAAREGPSFPDPSATLRLLRGGV